MEKEEKWNEEENENERRGKRKE